jgi:hypothetical protein
MSFTIKSLRYAIAVIVSSYLSLLTFSIQAEQLIKADGYNIHYNAFNSSMLNPEVVNQYGIERSSSLGVIMVSVLEEADKAVSAYVAGNSKNSIFQLTTLDFKQITEGEAVYYIATFNFADKEQLNFDITIVPKGITHKIKLNFKQQFFVE